MNDPNALRRREFKLRGRDIAVDFDINKSEFGTRLIGIENSHSLYEIRPRIHLYLDFLDILAFPVWRQLDYLIAWKHGFNIIHQPKVFELLPETGPAEQEHHGKLFDHGILDLVLGNLMVGRHIGIEGFSVRNPMLFVKRVVVHPHLLIFVRYRRPPSCWLWFTGFWKSE